MISWENLIEETRTSGSLAVNPKDITDEVQYNKSKNRSDKVRNGKKKRPKDPSSKIKKIKNIKKLNSTNKILYSDTNNNTKFDGNVTGDEHDHWSYAKNLTYLSQEDDVGRLEYTRNQWITLKNLEFPSAYSERHHLSSDGFFCGVPS